MMYVYLCRYKDSFSKGTRGFKEKLLACMQELDVVRLETLDFIQDKM